MSGTGQVLLVMALAAVVALAAYFVGLARRRRWRRAGAARRVAGGTGL